MNYYLAHEYAITRERDIRSSVTNARTTDEWHGKGHTLSERVGRTLIHLGARLLRDEATTLGARLLRDEPTALNLDHHLPRAAA
jgi:hypothetical protein